MSERSQAVRRAQARAREDVAQSPFIVKLFLGWLLYSVREARYEREELRALKRKKAPHPEG